MKRIMEIKKPNSKLTLITREKYFDNDSVAVVGKSSGFFPRLSRWRRMVFENSVIVASVDDLIY